MDVFIFVCMYACVYLFAVALSLARLKRFTLPLLVAFRKWPRHWPCVIWLCVCLLCVTYTFEKAGI